MKKSLFNYTALVPSAAILAAGFFAFRNNIYRGLDGSYYLLLAKHIAKDYVINGLTLSHLQGCSSLQFPVNLKICLTFIISSILPFSEQTSVFIASYTIVAVGSLLTCKILNLNLLRTSLFIILNCITLLPLSIGFYGIADCSPIMPEITILIFISLTLIYRAKKLGNPLFLCLGGIPLVYINYLSPASLIFITPLFVFFLYVLLKLFKSRGGLKNEIISTNKIILSVFVLIMAVISIWSIGHILASPVYFFKNELKDVITPADISVFFWAGKKNSALALIAISLALAFYEQLEKSDAYKLFIARIAIYFFCVQLLAYLLLSLSMFNQRIIALTYFEYNMYPLYSLLIVLFKNPKFLSPTTKNCFLDKINNCPLGIIFCSLYSFLIIINLNKRTEKNIDYFRKPKNNVIIDSIINKGGFVGQEHNFLGRTESFVGIGNSLETGRSWVQMHKYSALCNLVFGNDFRSTGLWSFQIPTLFQYSPLRDPLQYFLTTRLLNTENDRQVKNLCFHTKPNPGLLGLLGVRFVISDTTLLSDEVKLIEMIPYPIEKDEEKNIWWNEGKINPWLAIKSINLYEINKVNLGQSSPKIVYKKNANALQILQYLQTFGYFDQNSPIAIVDKEVEEVEPLIESRLKYGKNGFEVYARSKGRSAILLPQNFSHCLYFQSHQKGDHVVLMRANLSQTLLIFDKYINGKVSYLSSPFMFPQKIWLDFIDCKKYLAKNN